jgi:hypothetical protein
MKIIQRLVKKEQYLNQGIFLMECGNGHRFEMDTTFSLNCRRLNEDIQAICPVCGDDETTVEPLNICC